MHRILVFSDSHGRPERMLKLLEEEQYDLVYHLGDIEGDEDRLKSLLNRVKPLAAPVLVKGNCDSFSMNPAARTVSFGNIAFFLTHGHRFGSGEEMLRNIAIAAKDNGCGYALFGHIHVPVDTELCGVRLFNPGSISRPRQENGKPSYGVITIGDDGSVSFEHKYVSMWS